MLHVTTVYPKKRESPEFTELLIRIRDNLFHLELERIEFSLIVNQDTLNNNALITLPECEWWFVSMWPCDGLASHIGCHPAFAR